MSTTRPLMSSQDSLTGSPKEFKEKSCCQKVTAIMCAILLHVVIPIGFAFGAAALLGLVVPWVGANFLLTAGIILISLIATNILNSCCRCYKKKEKEIPLPSAV
jgi:hypothetical protein